MFLSLLCQSALQTHLAIVRCKALRWRQQSRKHRAEGFCCGCRNSGRMPSLSESEDVRETVFEEAEEQSGETEAQATNSAAPQGESACNALSYRRHNHL